MLPVSVDFSRPGITRLLSHRLTQTKSDEFFRLKVSSAFVRGKKTDLIEDPPGKGMDFTISPPGEQG
jgi:hypothetical protein